MRTVAAPAPGVVAPREPYRQTLFDVAAARRALPYMARVTDDATDAFAAAHQARQALRLTTDAPALQRLCEQRDQALRRLDTAIDECDAVGADLIDIRAGMIRFHATINGRRASLLWRLGERITGAWRDVAGD